MPERSKFRSRCSLTRAMACWPTSELPARAKGRSLCPEAPSKSSAGACKRRPSYAAEPKAPTVMVCRNAERRSLLQAVTPCSGLIRKNITPCRRLILRCLRPRLPIRSASFRKRDPKSHKSLKTELMVPPTSCRFGGRREYMTLAVPQEESVSRLVPNWAL